MIDDHSDVRRRAARLSAAVRLNDVRTVAVSFELHEAGLAPPWKVDLRAESVDWEKDGKVLGFRYRFAFDAHCADGGEVFSGQVTLAALYETDAEDLEVQPVDADAFARLTVLFTVYPYLRETVQALTSRAGLPPVTLDVIRLPVP